MGNMDELAHELLPNVEGGDAASSDLAVATTSTSSSDVVDVGWGDSTLISFLLCDITKLTMSSCVLIRFLDNSGGPMSDIVLGIGGIGVFNSFDPGPGSIYIKDTMSKAFTKILYTRIMTIRFDRKSSHFPVITKFSI